MASSPPPQFNPNTRNNGYPYENFSYKFNASMAIIVVVLVTTFFFMALFVLYIRRCNLISTGGWIHDTNNNNNQNNQNNQDQQRQRNRGLDQEALQSLPIMRYSSIKVAKKSKAGPECVVCLLQFEEPENVRLLPECGHLFHTECIDMWLQTHCTCPLCRATLDPKAVPAGSLQRALSAVMSSFRRDPNSNSLRTGLDGSATVVGGDERAHADGEAGGGDLERGEVNASRRHQGEVVRALSLHSESFRNAVHDMDLLEVREKLRARSIRVPASGPVTIHHSRSFAGSVHQLHDHDEHRDEFPSPENQHDNVNHQQPSPNVGLRRSVSDSDYLSHSLWSGETSTREDVGSGKPVFTGFARRSLRRSWKWLVGGSSGGPAAPASLPSFLPPFCQAGCWEVSRSVGKVSAG